MRGLMITLALALFGCAAWAAAEARDSDAQHNARIRACIEERRAPLRGLRPSEPHSLGFAECGALPKAWDQQTLILAAVLGLGGVVALIGAGVTRRMEGG